ncbi:MAG: alpha-mannosidase, partial [Acholeplasmataceae bacterium]|nr:alpha-mannosidase [Acholeplasmataceae bacterium]
MEFNLDYEKGVIDQLKHMINHLVKNKIDTKIADLTIQGFITDEPIPFRDISDHALKPFKIGDSWGKNFACGWFRITGHLKSFSQPLYLKLDLSGEACLFDNSGTPLKGFTNGSSTFDRTHGEPGKVYYQINHLIQENGSLDFWVEAGSNDLFGVLCDEGRFKACEIVAQNEDLKTLYDDLETLLSLLQVIDQESEHFAAIYEGLRSIYYLIVYEEDEWIAKSIETSKKLLSQKTNYLLKITAIGHAHMDLAWLWPIRETRRKIGRTFASVIDLLDHHPDFVFGVSQPQMLTWVSEDYPLLFEKIKAYVKMNRIELQGGMWVEADTNVSGEEALVRQMLYGIEYYKKTFNFRVRNLWLPDVFGYSGSLPQIISKSGLDYFMTTKLSWSLINRFPYHSFNWLGIDGSKTLSHMPPEGTYNSSILPKSTMLIDKQYKEKEIAPLALAVYGIGNGGGGPGYEHLARIDRQKNLAPLPKVSYGTSASFFDELKAYEDKLPSWQGELYLENHQGTYTTQSNVKQYNRKLEQKLRSLEVLLSMTQGYTSEIQNKLDEIWKEFLLYQFHDILPGSSIKRVYDECLVRYQVLDQELDSLFSVIDKSYLSETMETKLLFNPLSYPVKIVQKYNQNYYNYVIDAYSFAKAKNIHTLNHGLTVNHVKTKDLIIQFDDQTGQLTSIYHIKQKKELLRDGKGNILSVYKDYGDAWNIPDHYRKQTPQVMKLELREVRNSSQFIELTHYYSFKQSKLKEI